MLRCCFCPLKFKIFHSMYSLYSEYKYEVIFIFVSLEIGCFFLLFKELLIFVLLLFKSDMSGCSVFSCCCYLFYAYYLSCFVFSHSPRAIVCFLTLIWINSKSLLFQIFLLVFSLFYFLYSHYAYVIPFVVAPQFFDILGFFFFFTLFFAFGFPRLW